MIHSFHTGHAYVAFDRVLSAVNGALDGRVPAIGDRDASTVKRRLMQRIVDVALWPYIGICGRRCAEGLSPIPLLAMKLDCGGVIFHGASGRTTLTLRRFGTSLLEYIAHWVNLFGAIVIGAVKTGDDQRSATLVFGVGEESLFYKDSDARFVAYCRNGPITPLATAERLFVHRASMAKSTSCDIIYDRFPLAALIRHTRLGMIGRGALLVAHLKSLLIFFVAVIKQPLLALLARDIAYASAMTVLDRRRLIAAVVTTNSMYHAQPLWMRGRHLRNYSVHMVWYSQNTIPFVYAGDNFAAHLPNNRYIEVDETWVWTEDYRTYLESFGVTPPIHVVGPILWYLPPAPIKRSGNEIRIVIFDVTPLHDEAALRLGLIANYYSGENMIRFVEEVIAVSKELEVRLGGPIRLAFKHKRSYNANHDRRYIKLIEHLVEDGVIEFVPFQANMYSLLEASDLSIVVPYSSPAYVANHLGKNAIFFDPTMTLAPTFEPAPFVTFASGRQELFDLAFPIVSAKKPGIAAESVN